MSERIDTFEVGGTPVIQVRIPSGSLRFAEGARGAVVVRMEGKESAIDRYRVQQTDDLIQIEPEGGKYLLNAGVRMTIETGVPPEVRVKVSSGDVSAAVEIADLQIDSASGDIRFDRVSGDVTARSASGDLKIGSISGFFKASLASGDVQVGVVEGGADLKTASGDVRIKIAEGGIKAKSASGDVSIDNLRAGDFDAKLLSGDVLIGLPSGRAFDVSLDAVSGKVSTEFPVSRDGDEGADERGVSVISIKTVSGDIALRPAN